MAHFHVDKSLSIKVSEKKSKEKISENDFLLAKSINMGYYLIVPILVGVFIGVALDKYFKTESRFAALFLFLGVLSTFYNLFKLVKDGEGSSH
jgi:F0F1-type ATP synthase assembly protein I